MFETLFEALFSYRPIVFQEGEFRFDVTTASLVATVLVGAVVAMAALTYRRVRVADGRTRDRVILTALRVAALGLVLFCLFRPTLVVRAAVAQQNVLAVLLDDSRSMQIPDWAGQPRGDANFEEGAIVQGIDLGRFVTETIGIDVVAVGRGHRAPRRRQSCVRGRNGLAWIRGQEL